MSSIRTRRVKDIAAGVVFLVIAGGFAFLTSGLKFGTALQMGPGYFPVLLSGFLALMGVLTILQALRARAADAASAPVPWRALAAIVLAIIIFAAGVAPLGFVPALGASVFVSTLASRHFSIGGAAAITASLVTFSWAVFIKGLNLPLQVLGPWLGGA